MYPSPNIIAQIGIFVLGCIVGGTVGLEFLKDGISGPWATFAGASGGAIITVMGLAWLDTRKREHADAGISLRMAPDLIILRGKLRDGARLLAREDEEGQLFHFHILKKVDEAYSSWQKLQPMLDHFPDTAIDSYRLEKAFEELTENRGHIISEETFQRAVALATDLATRFKVDEVDLG